MITEIAIVCVLIYLLFNDYLSAKAEVINERARQLRLENDKEENRQLENSQQESD